MFKSFQEIAGSPKVLEPRRQAVVMALHAAGRVAYLPFALASLVAPRRRLPPLGPSCRILLMRVDGVGDFIMSSALFPALRRTYPDARIDLVCSTLAKPLAEEFVRSGDIDHLYPMPLTTPALGQVRRLISGIRASRYDLVADLRGDFRNVLLGWLSGAPRRLGLPYSGLGYLLTGQLPRGEVHQVEEVAGLAELMGVPPSALSPAPRMVLGPEQREFARTWLAARHHDPARPLVAFHLSAGFPARFWPLDRFIGVGRRLAATHHARCLVVGAPGDRELANAFSAALTEPALIAAGKSSLPQTSALLERCSLFIGSDSGPAHIAAASGCPVVVLFGPGNDRVMRPYTAVGRIVKSPRPCDRNCHNKTCAVPERHCLAAISIDDVYAAADELLQPVTQSKIPVGNPDG